MVIAHRYLKSAKIMNGFESNGDRSGEILEL
jgi:hypothetical protein